MVWTLPPSETEPSQEPQIAIEYWQKKVLHYQNLPALESLIDSAISVQKWEALSSTLNTETDLMIHTEQNSK